LKLGIYEILHVDEVPPIVSVNEAIELAKKFGDTNSGRFINGVLSAVLQKHCPEAKKKMMQKTEKKS
jgi:N utilization substance protein B